MYFLRKLPVENKNKNIFEEPSTGYAWISLLVELSLLCTVFLFYFDRKQSFIVELRYLKTQAENFNYQLFHILNFVIAPSM